MIVMAGTMEKAKALWQSSTGMILQSATEEELSLRDASQSALLPSVLRPHEVPVAGGRGVFWKVIKPKDVNNGIAQRNLRD